MSNKTILAAVILVSVVSASADRAFFEGFDGSGYGYLDATQGSTVLTDVWADFQNRLTNDVMTNGVISGMTSAAQNAQIRSYFDIGLDASKVTNVTVRLRIDINNDGVWNDELKNGILGNKHFSLYYAKTRYTDETNIPLTQLDNHPDVTLTITSQADGWSVWSMSFAEGALTGNLKSLRLDPRGSTVSVPFELDSVAIYTSGEKYRTVGLYIFH
jgi:hypothetical protein